MTYSYVADRDGFMCIHLNLPKRNDYHVIVNGQERYKESISLPQMIAVGDVDAGDLIEIKINCEAGESSTMTVSAAILEDELFWEGYDILSASLLELTSFETTRVEGTILCDRDGLLYASIPQNGNWSVTVDGAPAEIKLVGECMIGVELAEGEHNIVYTYENRAFDIGWKVTLACVAIFLVLIQVFYKPDWKKLTGKRNRKK